MLDDKIYNSLLHVIRKCVRIPSVLNVIQVADTAEVYQTEARAAPVCVFNTLELAR